MESLTMDFKQTNNYYLVLKEFYTCFIPYDLNDEKLPES